jgi:hypothetical protein
MGAPGTTGVNDGQSSPQVSGSIRVVAQVGQIPRFSLARRKPGVQIPSPPPHKPWSPAWRIHSVGPAPFQHSSLGSKRAANADNISQPVARSQPPGAPPSPGSYGDSAEPRHPPNLQMRCPWVSMERANLWRCWEARQKLGFSIYCVAHSDSRCSRTAMARRQNATRVGLGLG